MKFIKRALKEVFDFFCGDWRIFWGVAVTIAVTVFLIKVVNHRDSLVFMLPFAGIIFVLGISLSLVIALKRETTR